MGESKDKKRARSEQLALARQEAQREAELLALQKQIYGQISPFATGLLGMGQDALKGIAPDYFQLGTRNAIAQAFGGERQNLADFLGTTGQGFGGLAAGPAANLGALESTAIGQAQADAIQQALGFGLQGGGLFTGQQQIFDPTRYGGLAAQGFGNILNQPGQNLGASALGALGAAATGSLSKIKLCWVAAELYGYNSYEMLAIRDWLLGTPWMRMFVWFYEQFGERWACTIKHNKWMRQSTKFMFDRFLIWANNS